MLPRAAAAGAGAFAIAFVCNVAGAGAGAGATSGAVGVCVGDVAGIAVHIPGGATRGREAGAGLAARSLGAPATCITRGMGDQHWRCAAVFEPHEPFVRIRGRWW